MVTTVLMILLLLSSGAAFTFWRKWYSSARKIHSVIKQQELEKQEWEDSILLKQTDYLEEELQRMGADVHDDLIHRLTEQMLTIERLIRAEDLEHAQAYALQLKNHFHLVVRSVREISYRLLPPSIDSPSLVRALEDLVSRIETPGVARISVSSSGKEFSLNSKHQAHLVRIVQELVYNATKHTPCWHVYIKLEWLNDSVIIYVEDDGRRAGEAELRIKNGKGFRTVRMRLLNIKASLRFETDVLGLRAIVTYPDRNSVGGGVMFK